MGSIVGKLSLGFKSILKSGKHPVKGFRQRIDLIISAFQFDPFGQITAAADLRGCFRDPCYRTKSLFSDPVAAQGSQ